jgi:hypothetical protein
MTERQRKFKINDSMRAVGDVIQNLVALEDHSMIKTDRCKRCLEKHLLKASCAAKDSIEQDHKPSQSKLLEMLERCVRGLWKDLEVYEKDPTDGNARRLGTKIRRVRVWMLKKFNITHILAHLEPV